MFPAMAAASWALQSISAGLDYSGKLRQAGERQGVLDERMRRLRAQQEQVVGQARAAGAASGVRPGSASLQTYLSEMQAEFARQAEWDRASGQRAIDRANTSAGIGFAGDMVSAMFSFGQQTNWWKR